MTLTVTPLSMRLESMRYEIPSTYYLTILYLDSTLFCILEWNSLNIYVIHFYFDDLKTKVNEKSANCYLVFMVLFYGSFTLVLNSNVTSYS